MKNIVKVALLPLLCIGMISCDLDKYPHDAILESEGFKTFKDAGEFRNGFYNVARGCFMSSSVIPVNIQAEGINATKDYGNNLGNQYSWNFSDDDAVVSGIWTNGYTAIFQINYFLGKANELLESDSQLPDTDDNKMDEKELEDLNLYIAEARFFRAMINHQLATYYCKAYDSSTAATDLGIVLTEKADIQARLERSTLEKTYQFIREDIDAARTVINDYYEGGDKAGAIYYVGPYTVKALEAKVLLDMGEYLECAALCENIVAAHPLIRTQNAFDALWRNDTGTEIVFQFFASKDEGGSNLGQMFLNDPYRTGNPLYPYYIPTQWIVNQYDTRDIRRNSYFLRTNVRIGLLTTPMWVVSKYPGNPAYNAQAAENSLLNNARPYRSADFLLMAAECYAEANDLVNADRCLEQLLTARIIGTATNPYTYEKHESIEDVMTAIQYERLKEMFMEGNRIADLKRWGKSMSRLGMDPQSNEAVIINSLYLEIPAGDYRYVWPIPRSEMNFNHNLAGQQNEGWRSSI